MDMKSGQESVVASPFTLQTALASLIGITVLYLAREVLIPIALALLLSFLLAPPMVRLQRWGLGKTFAALLVVALSFSGLLFVSWAGFGQAYNLSLELPGYRDNISTKLRSLTPRGLAARGRSGSFTPSRADKNLRCGPRVRTRASGGMCFPVLCTSEPRSRAARKPATPPPRAPADRAACPCPAVAASPATG